MPKSYQFTLGQDQELVVYAVQSRRRMGLQNLIERVRLLHRVPMEHGKSEEVNLAVWLSDDPELAMVTADMKAWSEAHPCKCEALCECEE
jgi:hypothetical protein